jgi:hypothetical protein
MRVIQEMRDKVGIAGEMMVFLWRRKMWWMIPIVTALLFFGLIVVFGSSTGAGPFIYTIF